MNDIVKPLIDEIKKEMHELTNGLDGGKEILEWVREEYSRYMIVSSDAYAETIKVYLKDNPEADFKEFFEMLLKHLGKYASTQAIFRAANELAINFGQ